MRRSLRTRVLAAAGEASPVPARTLSSPWFVAAVPAAAAALLNLSGSAALALPEPSAVAPDSCAIGRALHQAPELCRSTPQENP